MIVKLDHRDNNHTVVANKVLTGKMSLEAKGLLCWFLSKKDDYKIDFTVVSQELNIKESRLSKLFKELVSNGFAYREFERNSKGHVLGSEYHVTEIPFYRHDKNTEIGKKPTFGKSTDMDKNRSSDISKVGKNQVSESSVSNNIENQEVSNDSPNYEFHRSRQKPNIDNDIEDTTILNNNLSSNHLLDSKNTEFGKNQVSVTFEDFRQKYDKQVKDSIWETASRSWNELSGQDQLTAYEFLTDYIKLRIPKYRKHPHRYLGLREWENPEVIQEIKDMKQSEKQTVPKGFQPRKNSNETVLDAKMAIQELPESQQIEVQKMLQDFESSVKDTDEWFSMGRLQKKRILAEKANQFIQQVQQTKVSQPQIIRI